MAVAFLDSHSFHFGIRGILYVTSAIREEMQALEQGDSPWEDNVEGRAWYKDVINCKYK